MNFPGYKNGRICPKCVIGWIIIILVALWAYHHLKGA